MNTLNDLLAIKPETDEEWDAHCVSMRELIHHDPSVLNSPKWGPWLRENRKQILASSLRRFERYHERAS